MVVFSSRLVLVSAQLSGFSSCRLAQMATMARTARIVVMPSSTSVMILLAVQPEDPFATGCSTVLTISQHSPPRGSGDHPLRVKSAPSAHARAQPLGHEHCSVCSLQRYSKAG